MTDAPILLQEDNDNIRTLTLNRPTKLNALDTALVGEIVAAVAAAHADDDVAAIIIAGSGRAFSAGADLGEAATRAGDSAQAARLHSEAGTAIYNLGARTDKPLIAAVHGYVLGGGCNLAISADMVVAGESALFGYPEVKRGLAATLVTPGLVHRIGPKAAFEMVALGENISAARALELGLINRVVSDDAVLAEAVAVATAFTALDGAAVRATKRVFLKSTELTLAQSLDVAREAALLARKTG
jgi:enoyl-CoA hydratase/carnithine racemase